MTLLDNKVAVVRTEGCRLLISGCQMARLKLTTAGRRRSKGKG
jgi:hypothetical protein